MERLFIMDKKDYNEALPRFRRPSVRGIIISKGKVAMVYSKKFDYYKFPGGGIENNEAHIQTLVREVSEETGLTIIPDTVKEFGSVLRIQLSSYAQDTIFEQENFTTSVKSNPAYSHSRLTSMSLTKALRYVMSTR